MDRGANKNSGATNFDTLENDLENILRYPSRDPVCLPLDFLESITDGFSSNQIIGTGGFGVVYKGMLRSGNVIAVKKILDMHLLDDNKYQRELKYLMGITHQNVVQLVGYCVESKWGRVQSCQRHIMAEIRTRLLCFEYLGNGSLDKYISSDPMGFGWDRRYNIIEGICRGLYFLHEESSIVHLDLKPQNIMIDDDMVPKIMDFGLSRLLGEEKSKTITQNVTGSLGYMAPEYIDRGEISPGADIFSLGVIILETVTGHRNYPQTNLRHGQHSSEKNNPENKEMSLEEFIDKELGKWRKIFESSHIEAALQEVYSQQLKQLIEIALKCVDPERKKRPHAWDILQIFILNAGDMGLCDTNDNGNEASELLSLQSPNLEFSLDERGKKGNKGHHSSSSLHLNNNTYSHVAFRLVTTETLAEHFLWPPPGTVPPRCRYTLAVTMRNQQKPPQLDSNAFFTLESTMASIQGLHNFPRYRADDAPEKFFKKAKERGREVQQINLAPVYVRTMGYPKNCFVHLAGSLGSLARTEHFLDNFSWLGPILWSIYESALEHRLEVNQLPRIYSGDRPVKPRIVIIHRMEPFYQDAPFINVHSTEPWFMTHHYRGSYGQYIGIWDYDMQELVHFSGATVLRKYSRYYYQDRIRNPRTAKFIPRKRWIVVGSKWGSIKVYSYMAMRNFKGFKSCLFSKIKKFQAHENHNSDISLDVHPTRPFLLSASSGRRGSSRWTVSGKIKLWDWENGWVCVRTFDTQVHANQVKFNPMDPDRFVSICSRDDAKVWNISSASCESTLSGAKDAEYFDFFTRHDKLYLIIAHYSKKKATIWDYDNRTLVETLGGHTDFVTAVCSHPEFSILMTGSEDGTIRLWNKDTFRLEAILDCGLGPVRAIACLKGSKGIVIAHEQGLAITEFDQEESGASV